MHETDTFCGSRTMNEYFKEFFRDEINVVELFRQSNDGLIITNNHGDILMANPAFLEITGYSFNEVFMKNPRLLKSGETDETTYIDMWKSLRERGTWTGELINLRKNGQKYYSNTTITHIPKEPVEQSYFIGVVRDITAKKQAGEKIRYLAHHDPLTDLPNRAYFNKMLYEEILKAKKNQKRMALLFIDMDRFKLINDSFGHHYGDVLLKEIAGRLEDIFGKDAVICRFGGDEFLVLLPNTETKDEVRKQVNKLFNNFSNRPYLIANKNIFITASIGVSFFPDQGITTEELIKNADHAMFQTKEKGKNNYDFYYPTLQDGSYSQLLLGTELKQALEKNQFKVYYQLQMDATSNQPYGVEALIRWNHPAKGILTPAYFLGEAVESGLILDIDIWVMKTAIMEMKKWHLKGYSDLTISVNVSKQQFERENFVGNVAEIITETKIDPSKVCIEITEDFALIKVDKVIKKLHDLKKIGVKIALDDFGTGYSSLSQLIRFPVDILKIDQSFVRNMNESIKYKALVKSIIKMSNELGFKTVCEGVETLEQLELIREEGSDVVQGYLYEKPASEEKYDEILHKYQMAN